MDTIKNTNLAGELSDFSDGEIEEIDFLLSKDTDITDPCESDQIQKIFIDLTEISALFSDLNTTPTDRIVNAHYENNFENVLSRLKTFVKHLYLKISTIVYETYGDHPVGSCPMQVHCYNVCSRKVKGLV